MAFLKRATFWKYIICPLIVARAFIHFNAQGADATECCYYFSARSKDFLNLDKNANFKKHIS